MRLKKIVKEAKDMAKVDLGGYTWSKLGDLRGKSLYLCDDIIKMSAFSKSGNNDYSKSDVIKYLIDFYDSLSKKDKSKIKKNQDLGDYVFLLSEEEFKKFSGNEPKAGLQWWLRTPGEQTNTATNVFDWDNVDEHGVDVKNNGVGVRPAFLMKPIDVEKLRKILSDLENTYVQYISLCHDYIDEGGDHTDIEKIESEYEYY